MTVTSQPHPTASPALVHCENNEKTFPHGHHGMPTASRRCRCENARSRRVVTAFLLAAFALVLFIMVSCLWNAALNEASWLSSLGLVDNGSGSAWSAMTGFVKRQAVDTGSGESTFVHRKCTFNSS
ncbi:hypothetical protein PYCCODRAFT_1438178 [Trametes coccinea BRFM310]|uniref:Uncharacterized protein n=1 Tax=Trametes coccinea (strain BRFM310) TaxID=1353009 RepID=A0A1Y2IET6_TRAC3|nr:hypothetical protein PYCCODRAFT_1438178 [Trametes coccinea BRFM310]